MSMIEIEKDVPMPANAAGRKRKYPLDKLEIGDSFFVPFNVSNPAAVKAAVSHEGKRKSKSFVTRMEGDGIRVWRAA